MDKRAWPTGIRPSGRGLQIRLWRKRVLVYQETIECDPFSPSDIKAATNRRDNLAARLKLGLPLFEGDKGKVETVATVLQTFLDTLDAKESTQIGYENIFNCYWLPPIGNWIAKELTQAKIREVLGALTVKPKTKRNILSPLRYALDEAGINPNPARGIKIKSAQKAKVERYTPQQRDALLNALADPEVKLYFALLFGCGLRPRGEPLALEWTDYDGEALDISKQITRRKLELTTKTSHARTVYVPKWVRPLLNGYTTRFEKGYIFLNSAGGPHLDADKFIAAWKVTHKKCRIPYRHPYKCRHTRASELLSQGVDPAEAAKQMGHSVQMFLQIYAGFIEEFAKNKDKARFEGMPAVLQPVGKSVGEKL